MTTPLTPAEIAELRDIPATGGTPYNVISTPRDQWERLVSIAEDHARLAVQRACLERYEPRREHHDNPYHDCPGCEFCSTKPTPMSDGSADASKRELAERITKILCDCDRSNSIRNGHFASCASEVIGEGVLNLVESEVTKARAETMESARRWLSEVLELWER
ncbi:MAG TPA: hypothetical protein VM285_14580, partial [Polyangia bacterium]|nr:hypothetical protein [Polyangia bacterium]